MKYVVSSDFLALGTRVHLIHRPVGFCGEFVIKRAGAVIIIACNPADFRPFLFFGD